MTIEKFDSFTLHQHKIPYELISRQTVEVICNSDALAIWVYLQCKPQDWKVRRNDILTHFNISKSRYSIAMRVLREAGLIVSKTKRQSGGLFSGNCISVFPIANEETLSRFCPNAQITEAPSIGSPVFVPHTYTSVITNTSVRETTGKPLGTELQKTAPRSFQPPTVAQVRDYIAEKNYSIDPHEFHSFYESKGWLVGKTKMKSWKAAVRTWVARRDQTPAAAADYDKGAI